MAMALVVAVKMSMKGVDEYGDGAGGGSEDVDENGEVAVKLSMNMSTATPIAMRMMIVADVLNSSVCLWNDQ